MTVAIRLTPLVQFGLQLGIEVPDSQLGSGLGLAQLGLGLGLARDLQPSVGEPLHHITSRIKERSQKDERCTVSKSVRTVAL